jgi:hypothetical protein
MANEDSVDATPRPPFTPKQWPPSRKSKSTKHVPVKESSEDVDMDVSDNASFAPAPAGESADSELAIGSDSATESDSPAPPTKKQKVHDTGASTKVAEKRRKVDKDEEIVAAPQADDDGEVQTPKPKKMKMRDEINFAAKKIEEDKKGNKYGGMVESVFNKAESNEMPAPKAPSHLQAAEKGKNRKLKREGAIADINMLYTGKMATMATPDPDQHQNQVIDHIDNRYIILPYSHVSVTNPG